MLSIIISIVFFGMMAGNIFIFFYQRKLVKQLEKDSGVRITRSSQFAAIRDLKDILNSSIDDSLKIVSKKIFGLIKISTWLFFCSLSLIILIFILNAFFRWQY